MHVCMYKHAFEKKSGEIENENVTLDNNSLHSLPPFHKTIMSHKGNFPPLPFSHNN